MSKALVIKGANFSVNKIEIITIEDPIPCTNITLSAESIQFSSIGGTETLTATVAPTDTTDIVQWSTSDETVATVENGVVTCDGIGSATITAICGEHMATCIVTSTTSVNLDQTYSKTNGYYADGTDLTTNPVRDYVNAKVNERGRIYFAPTNLMDGKLAYGAGSGASYADAYPMPIPTGASHISVSKPEHAPYIRIVCLNSQLAPTNSVAPSTTSRVVANIYSTSGTTVELDIPENADSFAIGLYSAIGYTGEQITGEVSAVFT